MASKKRKLIYADTAVEMLSRLVLLSEHEKDILNLYIDQCMAADAEEVVRCKDCIFGKGSTQKVCPLYKKGLMSGNDYCSVGERRADA